MCRLNTWQYQVIEQFYFHIIFEVRKDDFYVFMYSAANTYTMTGFATEPNNRCREEVADRISLHVVFTLVNCRPWEIGRHWHFLTSMCVKVKVMNITP
jgi:hypothetical protein